MTLCEDVPKMDVSQNRRIEFHSFLSYPDSAPVRRDMVPKLAHNFRNHRIEHGSYFDKFKKPKGIINPENYCVTFSNRFFWEYDPVSDSWDYKVTGRSTGFFNDANWSLCVYDSLHWKDEYDGMSGLAVLGFDVGLESIHFPTSHPTAIQLQSKDLKTLGDQKREGYKRTIEGVLDLTRNVRWEKMLVAMFTDWARSTGFYRVIIQSAENNAYYSDDHCRGAEDVKKAIEENARLRERLRMRFNVTAKRMGFSHNGETGDFDLDI